MTLETGVRRPLASRNTAWAAALTRRLAGAGVSPNRISQASMAFAAVAGLAFAALAFVEGPGARITLLLLAALGCQLRLLCNLLDGMVAVEAGRGTADGAFWNEVPDRVSDILILAGAGIGAGFAVLGWAAASMAVLTAYVREFGVARGMAADFTGPMAKPHRMAALTLAALAGILAEALGIGATGMLLAGLAAIVFGAAVTVLRRALRLLAWLNRHEAT